MPDITILSDDEVENKMYSFLRKNGLSAKTTDLYHLLGGESDYIAEEDLDEETEETLKNRLGCYWLKDDKKYGYQSYYVDVDGYTYSRSKDDFEIGCRPVVKYSEIKSESYDKKLDEGVLSVSYGEYPQYAVKGKLKKQLEQKYENDELTKTGKNYTIYAPSIDRWDPSLNGYYAKELVEYIYNGKKYIRFEGLEDVEEGVLSTKEEVKENSIYWVEVMPIRWLVDIEKDTAIAEKVLLSGIQYYSESDRDWDEDREYRTSTINEFLNKYFSKEIIAQSKRHEKHKIEGVRKGIKLKKINVEKIEEMLKEEEPKLVDKEKIKTKKR